jgi:hypothetical protein
MNQTAGLGLGRGRGPGKDRAERRRPRRLKVQPSRLRVGLERIGLRPLPGSKIVSP